MRTLAIALLVVGIAACGSRSPLTARTDERDAGVDPADAAGPSIPPDATTASGCRVATEPELIAPIASEPGDQRIALDDTHVYWTSPNAGTVRRVSKCGGGVDTLTSAETLPIEIALFGEHIFWIAKGESVGNGSVRRAEKSGASPTTLVGNISGATALAVDSDGVFWSVIPGSNEEGTYLLPHAPSTPTKIASTGGYVGMALDTTHLYWAFHGIARVPKSGGAVEVLVNDRPMASNIALHDGWVYWTNVIGVIERVSKKGGAPTAIGPHSFWRAVTADSSHVYAASHAIAPGIHRVPLAGGPPELLSESPSTDVKVDVDQIYWAAKDGIWRLGK